MAETPVFTRGQTLALRNFRGADVHALETARTVAHTPDGVVAWIPQGAPCLTRVALDGRSIRGWNPAALAAVETRLQPDTWTPGGTLVLQPPRSRYAVHWWFDPAGAFRGWYINLQSEAVLWNDTAPHTLGGIDYIDECLDILVAPDRSWRWKDEEEFAERTGSPVFFTAEEAVVIRTEGIRLAALAEAGAYPFDGTWTDFRPDPAWAPDPAAAVPAGWDRPRGW